MDCITSQTNLCLSYVSLLSKRNLQCIDTYWNMLFLSCFYRSNPAEAVTGVFRSELAARPPTSASCPPASAPGGASLSSRGLGRYAHPLQGVQEQPVGNADVWWVVMELRFKSPFFFTVFSGNEKRSYGYLFKVNIKQNIQSRFLIDIGVMVKPWPNSSHAADMDVVNVLLSVSII